MDLVARAPNHLGDGVMALPAMHALARLGRLHIQAPEWGRMLYRDVPATVGSCGQPPHADVSVLFPPSFRVAWEHRRQRRRIGIASDGRRWLLTDVVPEGRHGSDTYANLVAAVAPQHGVGTNEPQWRVGAGVAERFAPVVERVHVGLNPVSKSGAVREWPQFRALADRLAERVPVVFYGGPGEAERVAAIAGPHPVRLGLGLERFAEELATCRLFVSNDSGAAHFARAVGTPVLVVYGSTSPTVSGPAGALAVEGPPVACRPCYGRSCRIGHPTCLDIPVQRVLGAVESALQRGRADG